MGKAVVETQYTTVTPSPGPPTSECLDPSSIRVSEVYDYRGPQGLASRRSTEVRFNADGSGGWQKFDVGYSYDRWANLSQIQYPTLTGLASWEEAPDPALSTDRRRRRRMRCGTSVGCRTRYRRLPG